MTLERPLTTFDDRPWADDESPCSGGSPTVKLTPSCGDRGGLPPDRAGVSGVVSKGDGGLFPLNRLYFGDNLTWLSKMDAKSVDLVYLDPPFNSKAAYNILYKSPDGED